MTLKHSFAIAGVVLAGFFVFSSTAVANEPAGTPIDHFVDCSDGFWWVTCGLPDPGPYMAPKPRPATRVVIVADIEDGRTTYLREWDGRVAVCSDRGGVARCVIQNTGAEACETVVSRYDGTVNTHCTPVPCLADVSHPACPLL